MKVDFGTIVGQPVLVESLKCAVTADKVANGYVFYGPKGSGKKLAASVFAAALNCKDEASLRPCGKCSSCLKFESNNHPNIEYIKPTGASIKIKQVRDVISDVHKKPFESGYKVVIFVDADKMTVDAQDAFLKTLEEPPSNTVFVLLAENQHILLPTILSRCQVYPVKPVSKAQVEEYLRRSFKASDEQIKLASIYSNGIIGRAVQMLGDDFYFTQRNKYFEVLSRVRGRSVSEVLAAAAEVVDNKQQASEFAEFLLGFMRDIMVYKELNTQSEGIISNIDRIVDVAHFAGVWTEKQVNDITDTIKSTMRYISHNVSVKNSIDAMLMNILEVKDGKDDRSQV